MSWTASRINAVATTVVLIMLAAVVILCFRSVSDLSHGVRGVKRAHQVLHGLEGISEGVDAAALAQRDFLIATNASDLERYQSATNAAWMHFAESQGIFDNHPGEGPDLKRLQAALTRRFELLETGLAGQQKRGKQQSVTALAGSLDQQAAEEVVTALQQLRSDEENALEHLITRQADTLRNTLAAVAGASLLACLVLGFNSYRLNVHEQRRQRMEQNLLDSEKRFRALWENAKEGMQLIDSEGVIVDANKSFCELSGFKHADLVGRPHLIIYRHVDDLESRMKSYRERFSQRKIRDHLTENATFITGKRLDLEISNSFIELQNEPPMLLSVFRDVSARKRAEDALRIAQNRFQEIVAASPAVIYSLKIEKERLRPIWSSGNIKDILDYDAEETLLPAWWSHTLHPEDRERLSGYEHELIEKGRLVQEYRLRHRNGAYHWVRDEKQVIRDENGNPMEVVGSWFDITDRKAVEAERERLIGELKTALSEVKALSGLLPICAHCKKIRDDSGYWNQVEFFIRDRSEARFSHGVCPECAAKYYPPVRKRVKSGNES